MENDVLLNIILAYILEYMPLNSAHRRLLFAAVQHLLDHNYLDFHGSQ